MDQGLPSTPEDGNAADDPARKPLVTFHRFVPQTRLPMRADRSAAGTLPTRAYRFCEAVVSASSFGYYVFPPINFSLMWDGGTGISWTYDGAEGWAPLTVAQFPNFRAHFDSIAPDEIREFSPPFVAALKEPGIVQIWTGIVARTRPGWSLLVRPTANLARNQGYDLYEGIIETDRWFGPLFTNVRLTRTNTPVSFEADFPFVQVQPIPREVYADQTLNQFELVSGLADLYPEDWDDYFETVVRPNSQTDRPRGAYAVAARKRRKGEG